MGLAYEKFGWLGRALMRLLYGEKPSRLRDSLEAAGMRIYPEAYMASVGLSMLVALAVAVVAAMLLRLPHLLVAPVLVLLIGYVLPGVKARDRAAKLDMEAPFAAAYISVMATGGLSPYASFRRLKGCDLLPHTARAAKQIEVDAHLKGMDPVAAIERSASQTPSKEYREFLMGYIYTLKAGGDVVHYLTARTEMMFRDLAAKLRAFGERAAMLLESYIAITILSTLGIVIVYLVSIAFRSYWQGGFSSESFILYAYVLIPAMTMLFIYLSDLSSFSEPIYETAPHKVFAASTPLLLFLVTTMFIPYLAPEMKLLPFVKPFTDFLTWIRVALNLQMGFEPAIGLGIALIAASIPAAVAHEHYTARRGRSVANEVTNFLRDMTEARKTGASPEACIIQLSSRPYGSFSRYLKLVARQIKWGRPFRVVYEALKKKITSWFALINLYILVDATDVGGGSPETLETMARYGEMQASLEKEKMAALRPLMLMPYVGAALMVFSTILCVNFMASAALSIGRQAIPQTQLITLIMPALVFQSYLTGILTGKISSGSISAGFKHAIALTAIALAILIAMHGVQILMG
ncbi:MAG: type II secretion system F family protein [Candidatus Nezhaarchaeota archaeon]|nr:type II secretion system F family protein [Candidatus Nezhaarchaeota archaeon]